MLQSLAQSLDQFDQAVGQGPTAGGPTSGVSAELDALGEELTQVVRLMDGLNRYRFADDPNSLAEWVSASNTVGRSGGRTGGDAVSPGTPPKGGEIKPAA